MDMHPLFWVRRSTRTLSQLFNWSQISRSLTLSVPAKHLCTPHGGADIRWWILHFDGDDNTKHDKAWKLKYCKNCLLQRYRNVVTEYQRSNLSFLAFEQTCRPDLPMLPVATKFSAASLLGNKIFYCGGNDGRTQGTLCFLLGSKFLLSNKHWILMSLVALVS